MEFRLLGPVELWADGQRCDIGPVKQRCLLASLLLNAGQPVPSDTLIEHIWDDRPPSKARETLYSLVTRLRKQLLKGTGDKRVEGRSGAYLINVPRESIDRFVFERLRDEARAFAEYGDEERALAILNQARSLWRGEPLADLSGGWARGVRLTLGSRRDEMTSQRIELEIRLGRDASVIGELRELLTASPFDEKLTRYLMLALHHCGRSAEALQVFRDAHHRRTTEIGLPIGRRLQELHQQILRDDPALGHSTGPQRSVHHRPPPNNLERDIPTFVGREGETRETLAAVAAGQASDPPALTVIAIDGMPGVGKTTLATHLAHRLAPDHPDAQLFLHLYGHNPERRPLTPNEALDAALRRLGIAPSAIPASLEDRVAVWRTQLARRRCVIVLDDAADHHQVRPLLPGASSSVVLVTSRGKLAALDGVRRLSLGVMPETDAGALLTRMIRPHQQNDEDLQSAVRLCGYLPVALRIAAGRLRLHSTWSLSDLISALSNDDRIGEFRADDDQLSRIFDLSYRELNDVQAMAFRRLGHHPGTDFTAHSATAATGLQLPETDRVIEELLSRNLLEEHGRGRFRFHDLVRDYARLQASLKDEKGTDYTALRRVLDYYLAGADRANHLCYPYEPHPHIDIGRDIELPPMETESQARHWFRSEYSSLIAAIQTGREHSLDDQATLLLHMLWPYLEEAGHWHETIELNEQALAACRNLDDRSTIADTLRILAHGRWRTGELEQAMEHAKEALSLFRELRDPRGEALILDRLGLLFWARREYKTALSHNRSALKLNRRSGDQHGQAMCLLHRGITLADQKRYQQAQDDFAQAHEIFRSLDDRRGLKYVLNNLGDLEMRLGNPSTALRRYEQAAAANSEIGRQDEAILLANIGSVYLQLGRPEDAVENLAIALSISQAIGDRQSEATILRRIAEAQLEVA